MFEEYIYTRKHPDIWNGKGVWCGWEKIVIGKSRTGYRICWKKESGVPKYLRDTDVYVLWRWYEIIEWNFCKLSCGKRISKSIWWKELVLKTNRFTVWTERRDAAVKITNRKNTLISTEKKTVIQWKKSENVWQFYCLNCPACSQKMLDIISYKM